MAGVVERKQMLLDDPDIEIVEEHRVYCGRCEKWLKLDEAKLYAASVWRCHKNTKSHNARAPFFSTSAPPPAQTEGVLESTRRQNSSASGSLGLSSKGVEEISPKASVLQRDYSRLRRSEASPSTASAPMPQSLPLLKLKVPVPARGDKSPSSASAGPAARSASTSNALAPTSTINKSRPSISTAQTLTFSQPASSKSDTSQRSMPPPASSPSTSKISSHSGMPQHNGFKSARAVALSGKVREPSSGKNKESISASRAPPPPERLSPHRQASYKALVAEHYIGTLEPFRAFCTLCDRWVDLSSRTPYSYGVWKGHVRKTERHNRMQTNAAEDEYDTTSEHSHDESAIPPASDSGPTALGLEGANSVFATSATVSLSEPADAPVYAIKNNDTDSKVAEGPESPVDHRYSNGLSHESQCHPASALQNGDEPSSMMLNPFALKATTKDSFGPRNETVDEQSDAKDSRVSLLEGDDISVLTDSSDDEPSTSQLAQKTGPITAMEKRRDAMLADPDAAVVEPRRVQCGICERWIKGSNTQEYSSHHWLKHKNKCARSRTRESDRWLETAEARKARLEADPDVEVLEPHRALCKLCNKWVKLCSRSRYSASHWLQHKKKCPALPSQTPSVAIAEVHSPEDPKHFVDDKSFNNKQPSPTSTAESRRAALAADPNILQLFPDRVQCKPCHRWIKLSMPVEYSPGHWHTHKECCPGQANDSTSKLQAALESRKKTLEEDPNIAELEPHRVHCGLCHSWVKLRQDCSYSLGKWQLHKKRCGQQSRGEQMGSSAEVDSASRDADDVEGGFEDLGDDAREALDVENALEADPDGEGDFHGNASLSHGLDGDGDIKMSDPHGDSTTTDAAHLDADDEAEDHGGNKDSRDGASLVCHPASHSSAKQSLRRAAMAQEAAEVRRLKLLQDSDVLQAEPQLVQCRRCKSWVRLEGNCSYMPGLWLAHKGFCAGKSMEDSKSTNAPMQDVAGKESVSRPTSKQTGGVDAASSGPRLNSRSSRPAHPLPKGKGKLAASRRVLSPMTLPPVPSRPRWPDEDERKQQFTNDSDVLRVEPHRLLCKHCNCWIRLHPVIRYSQSIWPQHKASCKQVVITVPGDAKSRAKSEKEDARQKLLEEDPYATDVGPHRVTCKACGTNIRLDTTYKYEGSHWRAHRSRCSQIPFHERLPKKRKITEQVHEPIAIADSSDSDDSDASSAPRPRPTSFFTDPLIIKPTEMFKRHSRAHPPIAASVAVAKAQYETKLAAHLQKLATELDASDRLMSIIQSAGDGIAFEERLTLQPQGEAHAQVTGDDTEPPPDEDGLSIPQPSLTPEPEAWVPRKRTREEEEEFDMFFNQRPLPPTPTRSKSKVRVCKLGKEAMEVVD